MRSTRKKVFGNRKKKEQLKAKREQKRLQKEKEDGTQAAHHPPTIISPEEVERDDAPKLHVKRKDRQPKEEAAPVDDRNKCAPPQSASALFSHSAFHSFIFVLWQTAHSV